MDHPAAGGFAWVSQGADLSRHGTESSQAASPSQASQPGALLGWMEALGDSTRLRLLRLLERHELGVAELCDVLQLPQSTVSRHLKILGDGAWARSRRQGTTRLYRVLPDELAPAARRLWILSREQTEHWATVRQDELRLDRRLRQRQTDSQAFFATAAGQWDKLRGELYGDRFMQDATLALLPADAVIADLGCGAGQMVAALAGHVKQVIGVDNSAAMLKAAQKRVNARLTGNNGSSDQSASRQTAHAAHGESRIAANGVDLRRGDLEAIPIDDAACDAALLLLVLTYVEDPLAVLKETRRILKPGGKAVIVDLLPHDREDFRTEMEQRWMGFAAADIRQRVMDAGFASMSFHPLPPEPQAKGPALFLGTATRAIAGDLK